MKLKTLTKFFISAVLTLAIIGGSFATPVFAHTHQTELLISYFTTQYETLQEYIDTSLAQTAGTTNSDWLFIALKRLDENLNSEVYLNALNSKPKENFNITDKERVALLYALCGKKSEFTDSILSLEPSILTVNEATYALILLDSNAYTSNILKRNDLINRLISLQLNDGGWALSGTTYDVDITAMTLQALSLYLEHEDVAASVSKALTLLSSKQTENGDFKSRGTPTCESTAQVIIALYSLGINPKNDSRFIKNGNTLFDGLAHYQTSEGLYSHFIGTAANGIATAQAACALASAHRFESRKLSIYRFSSTSIPREIINTPASSSDITSSSIPSTDTQSSPASSPNSEESSIHDIGSPYSEEDIFTSVTKRISYKYIASSIVILIFIAVCIMLFIKGKASLSRILTAAVVSVVIIAGILFINITSVKKHYSAELESVTENSKTVTFSINAEAISYRNTSHSADGYVISETKYVISEKSTPFSALLDMTLAKGIKLVYTGSPSNPLSPVYVTAIDNISEKQHGPLSGWIYKVNGISPDVSASEYILKDGDVIEWLYTLELGKDE